VIRFRLTHDNPLWNDYVRFRAGDFGPEEAEALEARVFPIVHGNWETASADKYAANLAAALDDHASGRCRMCRHLS